jgi:uncharacterized repeat protein (TIGR01451 family)
VSKTSNTCRPVAGGAVTYTIVVTNHGPDAATGVVIADSLPDGLTYLSSSATQGSYSASTGRWKVGTILDGGHASLVMNARVDADAGSSIRNVATVARLDQTDPDPVNDRGVKAVEVASALGTASTGSDLQRLGADIVALLLLGIATLTVARRRRTGAHVAR